MTRFRRTAALIAAATLTVGATACLPPSENDSEMPAPTEVTPDAGFDGAGVPTGTTETTEPTGEDTTGQDGVIQGETGEPDTIGESEPYAPGNSSPIG